jgi:hypothetical protein
LIHKPPAAPLERLTLYSDWVLLVGMAAVIVGVAKINQAAAWILGGLLVMGVWWLMLLGKRGEQTTQTPKPVTATPAATKPALSLEEQMERDAALVNFLPAKKSRVAG